MHTKPAFLPALFAAAVLSHGTTPHAQQRDARERAILVSVSTSNDTPVTDLTAADFIVRENGVAREVVRATAAPPPSHVALLIDDSQAMQASLSYLRSAVPTFIRTMAALTPGPQLALYTFGERPVRRVDYTPNPDGVVDASRRIFSQTGSGAYLMQTIVDACQDLRKREASSPIIVAFVAEGGPEYSTILHKQVAEALRSAGVSLWVVTLQQGSQPLANSELRERAALLGDVTVQSGGMNKVVLSNQAIESGFTAVTRLLTSRYLVFYGRPDAMIPPDRIEVTTRRRDLRVRASQWAGQ